MKTHEVVRRLSVYLVVLGALCTAAETYAKDPPVTSCSSLINQCGCTITRAGFYKVTAALVSSQGLTANADCVDVKAASVVLQLQGFDITGPGVAFATGAGIRLLPSARGTFVEGTQRPVMEFGSSTMSGWKYGIEVDSANNIVEDFESSANGKAGVFLNKANGNNINDFTAKKNIVYGVWLKASNGNQINCSDADGNGASGVYVGCADDGTLGSPCPGVGPSKNNRIYDHDSSANGGAGIAIDLGDTKNLVTDTFPAFSPNMGGADLIDENVNCDNNLWFGNKFTTRNQSCID
jgi:hypothetical protein